MVYIGKARSVEHKTRECLNIKLCIDIAICSYNFLVNRVSRPLKNILMNCWMTKKKKFLSYMQFLMTLICH